MKKTAQLALATFTLLAVASVAQTNVTESGGTSSGYLPKLTGASTIANSLLYDNGTSVIFGATAPFSGELFSIQKAQNAATFMRIYNSTSNTAASANYIANSNGSSIAMTAYSAGYTNSGIAQASTGVINAANQINIGTTTSTPLTFWADNTEKVRLTSNGDLCINVPNPSGTGNQIYFRGVSDTYHGVGYYNTFTDATSKVITVNGPILYGYSGGALVSSGSNLMALQWDALGNVHIGNSAPASSPYAGAMLTVNGVAVAKEIYVETSDWADYVFKKDYKLMPLTDVEKYISTNKHLPNVPSANEVETKGQNLGHLQITQMEKTEELYLYVIEMNKKLEALTEQNKKLSEEVNALKKK